MLIPKRFCNTEQMEALRTQLQEHKIPEAGIVSRRSVVITIVIAFWLIVGAVIYAVSLNRTP